MEAMAATRATTELDRAAVLYVLHPYDPPAESSVSYGEAVAATIGFPSEQVFKTLVAQVDGHPTVAIVPVAASLRLKSLAAVRGAKRAAMAEPADAERLTGYITGGISPFGQRTRLPIVLDDSALAWETICVSGGQRGLQIEVAPGLLAAQLGAIIAPISAH